MSAPKNSQRAPPRQDSGGNREQRKELRRGEAVVARAHLHRTPRPRLFVPPRRVSWGAEQLG